ncbi:MAG: hypothetical protein JXR91_10785 [Deltaproteobacteria bacterium]|nr:hypothetical protein [Deltaproteobacteria bacterium]
MNKIIDVIVSLFVGCFGEYDASAKENKNELSGYLMGDISYGSAIQFGSGAGGKAIFKVNKFIVGFDFHHYWGKEQTLPLNEEGDNVNYRFSLNMSSILLGACFNIFSSPFEIAPYFLGGLGRDFFVYHNEETLENGRRVFGGPHLGGGVSLLAILPPKENKTHMIAGIDSNFITTIGPIEHDQKEGVFYTDSYSVNVLFFLGIKLF